MQPVDFEIVRPEGRLGEGVKAIFPNGEIKIISLVDAYFRYGFNPNSQSRQ